MKSSFEWIGVALVVALAAGCASRPVNTVPPAPGGYDGTSYGVQYGVVQRIDTVRVDGRTSGAGAVIGGAVGGVIGHQAKHHRDLATGVGVVAGAIVGNEIEKSQQRDREIYRVTVRVDYGGQRSFDYAQLNGLRTGDRVRIENNQLYRL